MSTKMPGAQYAAAAATALSASPFSIKAMIKETAKTIQDTVTHPDPLKKVTEAISKHIQTMTKTEMSLYMIYIFIGIICISYILLIYYYLVYLHTYKSSSSSNNGPSQLTNITGVEENDEGGNTGLVISTDNPATLPKLYDYFINGAYNCCSTGDYKNGYVSLDQLKYVIGQGVRFLDFEIMSIDGQPVVSTTTNTDVYIKETFNYIPFSEVMDTVKYNAFTLSKVTNYTDPIILHLRMHSNDQTMYDNFATLLENYDNLLLSPKFSYASQMTNFANTPLFFLMKKISIIIDVGNDMEITEDFSEMVNMTSRSPFLQEVRASTLKANTNVEEEIDYNKTNFTIVLPDTGANPPNPDSNALRNYGAQVVAMRYQLNDDNLDESINFFTNHSSAFVLKPAELRPIVVVKNIPAQNTAVAYGRKPVNLGFGLDATL